MEANELRLGNLVMWNVKSPRDISTFVGYDDEIIKIRHLSDKSESNWSLGCNICQLVPIPLTEEWLLKFVFVTIWSAQGEGTTYKSKEGNIIIHTHGRGEFTYPRYTDGGGDLSIEIKHVHQLQNLYFALVGEELTIKE